MISTRMETIGGVGDPAPGPFVRARLDSGLRILVRENPSLPLVAVDCWVGVGAIDETDEHAGISHFLEHMFFKGTRRYPTGAMDRIVKGMGGYNNAATSMEYTHYFIVAPSEHFATALDLLADHLTGLTLPEDELDRERQVVKEEIRRKDDSPSGRLYTLLSTAAFGRSPYAREVLGTPESLDRIDRDTMDRYWREHYTADRLVMGVAGAVDAAAVVDAVTARLGSLAAAPPAPPDPPPPPVEPVSAESDMAVGQGYLAWAFRTPGRADLAEACALEIGATILGEGDVSRLHRRLVDELRLVTAVQAWTFGLERVGLMGVDAVHSPERRAAVEEEVGTLLEAAARHGVSEAEVRRARTMLVADFAYDNETNAAMTGTLGEFETLYGDAGAYREVLQAIAEATAEEVSAALARWLDPGSAVRAWVGPDAA